MGRLRHRPPVLNFHVLRNCERVLKIDTKVSDRTVHLGVTEQKLNCTEIAGFLIDLRDLGAPHRMCAVCARPQTN